MSDDPRGNLSGLSIAELYYLRDSISKLPYSSYCEFQMILDSLLPEPPKNRLYPPELAEVLEGMGALDPADTP